METYKIQKNITLENVTEEFENIYNILQNKDFSKLKRMAIKIRILDIMPVLSILLIILFVVLFLYANPTSSTDTKLVVILLSSSCAVIATLAIYFNRANIYSKYIKDYKIDVVQEFVKAINSNFKKTDETNIRNNF